MDQLIDGKAIAAAVTSETKEKAAQLKRHGIVPGLAVVLVGNNPASEAYIRTKDRVASELGFNSRKIHLPETTTQTELLTQVQELNGDSSIHGILVQSPAPAQIDESAVVESLNPAKDVDGLHPINVGKLAMGDPSGLVSCTPLGCQRLLTASGFDPAGAHVVVLGRSMLVGKPVALLLMAKAAGGNATVTVAHSRSRNLPEIIRGADILIAAIGQPEFVRGDYVKEGVVVIDVGINRIDDPAERKGYRIVGDVAFDEVAPKARAITPVPGGVGPMTVAMLMENTLLACQRQTGLFI